MIPFLELKRQYHSIKGEVDSAIAGTFEAGNFILGEKVEAFEKAFARYCNARHCISVGSGTDALNLSVMALGIKSGDEVVMPSHTFIATAFAAINAGAKPVFADIDEKTYNISASGVKKAITQKTRAILPVHLYGQYCDMAPIMEIASKNNLNVIEDCSQSHGAEYNGKRKLFGNVACYSFYPTKNLGCYGDGGAVVTDDGEIADKLRLLRNYGQLKKYEHVAFGYNTRLDEIQAAILLVKLKHLDSWNERRRKLASLYTELLGSSVITPYEADYAKHAYYIYCVRSKKRDALQKHLEKNGVKTLIHYPIPVHRQRVFSSYNSQRLEVTERVASEILSLPMFPELAEAEVKEVAAAVNSFR